jgi:hypothetical protein
VYEIKEKGWVIQFKVRLQGIIRAQWYELATKLNRVTLDEEVDVVHWKWNVNKIFSVKSVYEHLTKVLCAGQPGNVVAKHVLKRR